MGKPDKSIEWRIANLEKSNTQWKIAIVSVVLGASFGGVSTYLLSQNQQATEQQNIAQALFLDVSIIEDHFNSTLEDLNLNLNNMNSSEKSLDMIWVDPRPYYSNNGLYFGFQKDISKFDTNLSADLYSYYLSIMNIEYKRQYIYNCVTKMNNGQNLSNTEETYMRMYSRTIIIEIIYSIPEADKIKKEIKEKYHLRECNIFC